MMRQVEPRSAKSEAERYVSISGRRNAWVRGTYEEKCRRQERIQEDRDINRSSELKQAGQQCYDDPVILTLAYF